MLLKVKRLNLKKDFKWVASGQKLGNNLVQLYIRQGDNLQPRIGIALSKTNFKKATQRNRARRIVSTGFQAMYDRLPEGINIVAIPRSGVLELNSVEITEVLEELLRKNKLLQNEKDNSVIA